MNPTKEKILKEFKKMFVLASSSFDTPVIVMGGEEYETLEPIKSFLSSSLDTYGKEQREEARKEILDEQAKTTVQLIRAQALDEAIAAIKAPKHCLVQSCVRCEEQERAINILNALRKK